MKTVSTPSLRNKPQDAAPMNHDLHRMFVDELADALHAEYQLTKALPKLIKAAESEELANALQAHLEETEGQITRLEEVFVSLDEKPRKKPCKGMQGILEEGDEMVKAQKASPAMDAAIIAASQKAEHYEIAAYGTLLAWAKEMGHDEAIRLLNETLAEEKHADKALTEIALGGANRRAEA